LPADVEQTREARSPLARRRRTRRIERQHKAGKLTARERIDGLLDPDSISSRSACSIAYDRQGQAPVAAWSPASAGSKAARRDRRQ